MQNCYNAEKVLSYVAPSSERVNIKVMKLTLSHLLLYVVYVPKS